MEDVIELFKPGQKGSKNYRIPSLLVSNEGTLLAAIDKRNQHQSDWGNIDIAMRRSFDHGKSWTDDKVIIDLKSNPNVSGEHHSAFLIDVSMVQDRISNRIFLLVDMFCESKGFFSVGSDNDTMKTPYVEIDGSNKLLLRHEEGHFYYLEEDGKVFTLNDRKDSGMHVIVESNHPTFNDLGDLYKDNTYLGNIYLDYTATPIKAKATVYLWLTYSDDDGATWASPKDITKQVRQDWMEFIGTGPGVGIQLENNNLLFPVYTTNQHKGYSQSSSMIRSKDFGENWEFLDSTNNRYVNNEKISPMTLKNLDYITTESQAVLLNSGTLKLFMRNYTGKVLVANSHDGGETWLDDFDRLDITDVYVQLSLIHTIRNKKEYILLANASGPERNNGTLKLLEVNPDDSLTLISETLIHKGRYEYNCLAELKDGNFAIFFEHPSEQYDGDMTMMFRRFSFEDLISNI